MRMEEHVGSMCQEIMVALVLLVGPGPYVN